MRSLTGRTRLDGVDGFELEQATRARLPAERMNGRMQRARMEMENTTRKRKSASIPSIVIATEALADAIHRATLPVAGCIAVDERQLACTAAYRVTAPAIFGIDPDPLDAILRRQQRLLGQTPEQVDPDLERTRRSKQAGRAIVVAANPDHAKLVAAEAGKPRIALAVAGAGL